MKSEIESIKKGLVLISETIPIQAQNKNVENQRKLFAFRKYWISKILLKFLIVFVIISVEKNEKLLEGLVQNIFTKQKPIVQMIISQKVNKMEV